MTRISQLVIVRVAGLAADYLELAHDVTPSRLRELDEAQAALAAVRRDAADALYLVVPSLEPPARRTALALRRRLHSHARGRMAHDVSPHLPEQLTERLDTAEQSRDQRWAEFESAVEADAERVPELIRHALSTPELREALELLSPGFLDLSRRSAFEVGSRHARTALSYLGRAAVKPSPLSSLTSVATGQAGGGARRVEPSPLFAYRLVQALVDHPVLVKTLEFKPAYAITGHLVLRRAVEAHGSAWLEEDIVSTEPYQDEIDRLREWSGGDFDSLAERVGGRPSARIARLVKLGIVQIVLPGQPGEPPYTSLWRSLLDRSVDDSAISLAQSVRALESMVSRAESSGVHRAPSLDRARLIFDELGQEFRVQHQTARLLNEDCVRATPRGHPLDDTSLLDWGRSVRPRLFRSHRYDAIVRWFAQEAGEGTSVPDAAGFFLAAQASPRFRASMRDAWAADREWIEGRSNGRTFLPVGDTNAPPTLGVLYQEFSDPERPSKGSIVINQLMNGVGGIAARFGAIRGETGGRIRADLLEWIDELFPAVRKRLAFHPSSEVNPLQGAARGILPAVEWPTDPWRTGTHSLARIGLRHDREREVLDFVEAGGEPVAVIHLGIVPAWAIAGARGLALCVMDPWIDGTELTLDANPLERARSASTQPAHRSREYDAGLVVRRETWMVEAADLPVPQASETSAEFVYRFDRWRRGIGLPVEVFGLAVSAAGFDSESRKPLWLNSHSAHSLFAVLPLLGEGTHVRFQEVLPGRVAGPDRVAEHLRLLRWERGDDV